MMQDPAMLQAAMQMMGGMSNPSVGGGAEGGDPVLAMRGGNPMAGMNPAMIGQLMQNPMMQQMTQSNPMMAQMMSDPQFLQMSMQMMSNPQMMQALGSMQGLPGVNPNTSPTGVGETPSAPTGTGVATPATNPMAAMMQDPAMLQAAMQMMG